MNSRTRRLSSHLADAEQLHRGGHLASALKQYLAHLKSHPADTEILHRTATLHYQLGDIDAATKAFRRAAELSPRNADYRNDLGAVFLARKHWDKAERCFREALALAPDYVQVRNNLGHSLVGAGRLDEAIECFREITRSAPGYVDAHFNLGRLLQQTGVMELAGVAYEQAIRLRPELATAHFHLGEVYRQLSRAEAAARCFRNALAQAPAYIEPRLALADLLTESARVDEAIPLLEEVLRLQPESMVARLQLARAREVEGNLRAAEAEYRLALKQWPTSAGAWFGLSSAKLFSEADLPEIAQLEQLLESTGWDRSARSLVHFALGKMLDDCRQYDRAFTHYRGANELCRSIATTPPPDTSGLTDSIIGRFDARFLASFADLGNDSELPVFIVGMPRSGTTLTEQIIASHPQAHGAGELSYIPTIAHGLHVLLRSESRFPQSCEALTSDSAHKITLPYLELLRWHSADAQRVTDKMPTNYRYLGLITMLFPRARIIHCERNAMDTCLSIYFQSFARGHEYSNDLAAIGETFRQYRRLMDHWNAVMPGRIHSVNYEALTADPEPHARALIAACGLEWDDACLDFDKNKRQVRTASVAQVREGIYTRSRERWRNYARHLGPLREALGPEYQEP